jgi:hypothetical protein
VFLHHLSLFARRFEVEKVRQNVGIAHFVIDHIKVLIYQLVAAVCMYSKDFDYIS